MLNLHGFLEFGATRYLVASSSTKELESFIKKLGIQQPINFSKKYQNYNVLIPLIRVGATLRYFDKDTSPVPESIEETIRVSRTNDTKARLILTASRPTREQLDSKEDNL